MRIASLAIDMVEGGEVRARRQAAIYPVCRSVNAEAPSPRPYLYPPITPARRALSQPERVPPHDMRCS